MIGTLLAAATHTATTNVVPNLLTHSADNGNGDPLLYFGLNWEVWLIIIIKCLAAFVALLVATALMIWFERKVISDMQSRIGPNRARPLGIAPDARRRDQAHLQGGPAARPGRLRSCSSWRRTSR